jgi:hypothetical protein
MLTANIVNTNNGKIFTSHPKTLKMPFIALKTPIMRVLG